MKCTECGKEYPSPYYFKVEQICPPCFENLDEDQKALINERLRENEKKEKSSLASSLKWVLNIFYYLTIAAAAILLTAAVAIMFRPYIETFESLDHFNMLYELTPVNPENVLTLLDAGSVMTGAELTLYASISFTLSNRWLLLAYFSISFIFVIQAIIVLQQLRKFLGSVVDGHPFIVENGRRLRIIGWTLIIAKILGIVAAIGFVFALGTIYVEGYQAKLDWNSIHRVIEPMFWEFFLALIVLCIAEIFKLGTRLQNEQSLTV